MTEFPTPARCPSCQATIEATFALGGPPAAGTLTVCVGCSAPAIFANGPDGKLLLEKFTEEQLAELKRTKPGRHEILSMAIAMVREKRGMPRSDSAEVRHGPERVYRMNAHCPIGHLVMASFALMPDTADRIAQNLSLMHLERKVLDEIKAKTIAPFCELCGATVDSFRYTLETTRFDTIEPALEWAKEAVTPELVKQAKARFQRLDFEEAALRAMRN